MRKILLLAVILGVSGCTSIYNTYSQQDPEVNFSGYRTFAWLERDSSAIQNFIYDSQFISEKIRKLSVSELQERGYGYSSQNPDLLVRYRLVVEEEQRIVSTPIYAPVPVNPYYHTFPYNRNYPYDNTFNYNYSYYGNLYNHQYNFNPYFTPPYSYQLQPHWGGGVYATTPVVTGSNFHQIEFDVGTLVIDLIDAKTDNLVWRGWSEGAFTNPEWFERDLDEIVEYIFDRFPIDEQQAPFSY